MPRTTKNQMPDLSHLAPMPKRLIIEADLRCPDAWPAIAVTALAQDKRAAYMQREEAVNRYLAGDVSSA